MHATNLLQLRLDRAFSQRELAERAGVTATTVFRAEHGEDVYPRTIRKLAEALGVTPRELTARSARTFDVSKR